MPGLDHVRRLVAEDGGLAVVTALRPDGAPHSSVVNAGVLDHFATGEPVVGFVARGGARKLELLRSDPRIAVTLRAGWDWATVEGRAELVGPVDPSGGVDDERLRLLLREVFIAAGGTHDDWDGYDEVMRDEQRTAVLVHPARVLSNAGG